MVNKTKGDKMKVLSYLELACKTHHVYKEYETWLCLNVPYNWELSIRDFYSQPFKPELITELFEGWGQPSISLFISNYTPPRTLDDFINDCQRAGIELTWKAND